MCYYGKRVGFRGSNLCEDPTPNCPMSRLVLPERVIQYEDGSVNTELDVKTKEREVMRQRQRQMNIQMFIMMIILVSLVYLLIR